VRPRFSREIAARIPGATLHVVPGAAHGYFQERPDVFNQLSLDFVARHSKGTTRSRTMGGYDS